MLKIAVCDDEQRERDYAAGLVKEYLAENHIAARVDVFHSAVELMEALHHDNYGLLFLDILMPGFSGIQAARELRNFDSETGIVFLTSSPEFAVESYRLDAFYYLLKPLDREELFLVLDRFLRQRQRSGEALLLNTASGLVRLSCGRIEAVEVNSRHLLFYLNDGSVREIPGTLTEYEPQLLKTGAFVKVHRSYLVNMDYIQHLQGAELTTSGGKKVPVSRLLSNQVRKEYMDYLFRKERGDQ